MLKTVIGKFTLTLCLAIGVVGTAFANAEIPAHASMNEGDTSTTNENLLKYLNEKLREQEKDKKTASKKKNTKATQEARIAKAAAVDPKEQAEAVKRQEVAKKTLNMTLSAQQLERGQLKLLEILSQMDNTDAVINDLIDNGMLALSPNDIRILRTIVDLMKQAENSPLFESDVINGMNFIDHSDRYKVYTLNINRTGLTTLEFLDANSSPWEIVDFTTAPAFTIEKGYTSNTLRISANQVHKRSNIFIVLKGYPNPIQFQLNYTNKQRHGLATYTLAYLSPSSVNKGKGDSESGASFDILTQSPQNNSEKKGGVPNDVLQHFASTGVFPADKVVDASKVLVSDDEICEIWSVNDTFLIRSSYIYLGDYKDVIYGGGASKVFVSRELSDVINFKVGGEYTSVYLPDYHYYQSQDNVYE